MFLLDVNVWLALVFQRHLHHQLASDWFSLQPDNSCCFCRFTQIGFLRLATTPQAMKADVLKLPEAWQAFDSLFGDPRVVYADEPRGLEPIWRSVTQHRSFSPKVWNDAYLSAFAQAAGWEVVTFDKGFRQYPNSLATILS